MLDINFDLFYELKQGSVVSNTNENVVKYFRVKDGNFEVVSDLTVFDECIYEDSKGNIWISFPSSDRNKVSEEDYIILKKKIGTGEEQVPTENKFKIIDIQKLGT